MTKARGEYVTAYHDHPTRRIAGVEVGIQEFVWDTGDHTWEVHHVGTRRSLTAFVDEGFFDHDPSDDEIVALLKALVGWWVCQGCGELIRPDEADLIRAHTRWCDLWQFQIKLQLLDPDE